MRIALATTGLITVLLTAGCGRNDEAQDLTAFDADESAPASVIAPEPPALPEQLPRMPPPPAAPADVASPPHIPIQSAPDVAFGYLYSFGIAADRISAVQQRHAGLCQELGPERCRVTGMNYRRKNEGDVSADLSLALEPGLAHRFGERALDSVREVEGKLVDSKISGTDVGSGVRAGTRTIAQLEEEVAELEARVARGGSPGTLRDLRAQADALRARMRALRADRSERRQQLATTPMTLSYSSRGMPTAPDFGRALVSAWEQTRWIAYGLFVLLSVLLPWMVALGLILLGLRALRRRTDRKEAAEAAPVA